MMWYKSSSLGKITVWALIFCLYGVTSWAQQAPSTVDNRAATISPAAPVEKIDEKKTDEINTKPTAVDPNAIPSIFFTPNESAAIAQAREQYAGKVVPTENEADLLEQIQGIKAHAKPEEELQEKFYAQFYLQTLIYHTPTNWHAWLKGSEASKKFSPETHDAPELGITLIQANKEDITFEWKPKNWLQVSKVYKKGDPAIIMDESRHVIIFTLRVNQTMASIDMAIHEGVAVPTPVVEGEATAPNTAAAEKTLPAGEDAAKNTAVPPAVPAAQPAPPAGVAGAYQALESKSK